MVCWDEEFVFKAFMNISLVLSLCYRVRHQVFQVCLVSVLSSQLYCENGAKMYLIFAEGSELAVIYKIDNSRSIKLADTNISDLEMVTNSVNIGTVTHPR
jgi:hypothetical protein